RPRPVRKASRRARTHVDAVARDGQFGTTHLELLIACGTRPPVTGEPHPREVWFAVASPRRWRRQVGLPIRRTRNAGGGVLEPLSGKRRRHAQEQARANTGEQSG